MRRRKADVAAQLPMKRRQVVCLPEPPPLHKAMLRLGLTAAAAGGRGAGVGAGGSSAACEVEPLSPLSLCQLPPVSSGLWPRIRYHARSPAVLTRGGCAPQVDAAEWEADEDEDEDEEEGATGEEEGGETGETEGSGDHGCRMDKYHATGASPSLGDAQVSEGDANISLGDAKRSLGDAYVSGMRKLGAAMEWLRDVAFREGTAEAEEAAGEAPAKWVLFAHHRDVMNTLQVEVLRDGRLGARQREEGVHGIGDSVGTPTHISATSPGVVGERGCTPPALARLLL